MSRFNYYSALRFGGHNHNNLHMTLGYYENVSPNRLIRLIENFEKFMNNTEITSFKLKLNHKGMLGWHNKIPVLQPAPTSDQFPEWIYKLASPSWVPHVTCKAERLSLIVSRIAIMRKQTEIISWELAHDS